MTFDSNESSYYLRATEAATYAQGYGRWVAKGAEGEYEEAEEPDHCYYYCWETPDGEDYKRHQVYVPVRVVGEVQRLIDRRRPIEEVLMAIEGVRQGKNRKE